MTEISEPLTLGQLGKLTRRIPTYDLAFNFQNDVLYKLFGRKVNPKLTWLPCLHNPDTLALHSSRYRLSH